MSRERVEALWARVYARWEELRARGVKALSFMEVCGTHTMSIGRFGLRARFPRGLRLVSGPGCPVCVTPAGDVDQAIELARRPGVLLATFGDMMRVPGSHSSLARARAEGARVRVVYSPAEALELARAEPSTELVFMGIGFETTVPTIAATARRALEEGLRNFSVLTAFKVVPPAMEALVDAGESRIDGFLCPGHVSTIIGCAPYEPLARRGVPCVVAGFEAADILEGLARLLEQRLGLLDGRPARVENAYPRAVRWEGNPRAWALVEELFEPEDALWRGIGWLPGTGLRFRPAFRELDARLRFGLERAEVPDLPPGCACGEVMRGLKVPPDCPLFGRACTPSHPVGPCMVSSEGACAAYYRYGGA